MIGMYVMVFSVGIAFWWIGVLLQAGYFDSRVVEELAQGLHHPLYSEGV